MPETIAWERPDTDDPKIRQFRYASFHTLSFRGSAFLMVSSTNSPGNGDTINLFNDPGYNLSLGELHEADSLIIAEYRTIYRFVEFTGDMIRRLRLDTLTVKDSILLFQNTRYKQLLQLTLLI